MAIALNVVGAALQTSSFHITLVWPFDHNSIFHIVQVLASVTLYLGLRISLSTSMPAAQPCR